MCTRMAASGKECKVRKLKVTKMSFHVSNLVEEAIERVSGPECEHIFAIEHRHSLCVDLLASFQQTSIARDHRDPLVTGPSLSTMLRITAMTKTCNSQVDFLSLGVIDLNVHLL